MPIVDINHLFDDIPVNDQSDIDRLLIKADSMSLNGRRSAVIINIAHMRIIKQGLYGLRFIEFRYRALSSETYIIGIPARYAPVNTKVLSHTFEPRPFYSWVGVNGAEEAEQKLAELGITAGENITNLDQTGMLMV